MLTPIVTIKKTQTDPRQSGLLHDREKAAVGISPQPYVNAGLGRLSRFLDGGKLLESTAIGEQNPSSQEDFVRAVTRTLDEDGVFAKLLCSCGHHRIQIQIPVRNMDRQDSVGPQMTKVELKSLDGQQVNRDGIAGEGVYREQIKLLARQAFQRKASVSQFERDACLGISQKTKVLLRDLHNKRIDLIERALVSRAAIRRNSAHAEANDSYAQRTARGQRRERYANSGIRTVIRNGLIAP